MKAGARTGSIAVSVESPGPWHGVMECGWLLLGWIRMVCVVAVQNVGWTALHRAASSRNADAVKALLAAEADVTATDVRGDVACVGGRLWKCWCVCRVVRSLVWCHGV